MLAVQHSISPSHRLTNHDRIMKCTENCLCSQFATSLDSASCTVWIRSKEESCWPDEKSILVLSGSAEMLPKYYAQGYRRWLEQPRCKTRYLCLSQLLWTETTSAPAFLQLDTDIDKTVFTAVVKVSSYSTFSKFASLKLPESVI